MTISYAETISSSQGGVFFKILMLWKGSLYKLVYSDLLVYISIYYSLNLPYRFLLTPSQRQVFEQLVKFSNEMDKNIPLSFILGFFVAGVIGRWWEMYLSIPWLDRVSFVVYGIVTGTEKTWKHAAKLRVTLMRYAGLAWILIMHRISEQISDRFPIDKSTNPEAKPTNKKKGVRVLLENINYCPNVRQYFHKMVTEGEIEAFERIEADYLVKYQKPYSLDYWLPLQWAVCLLKKGMMHGYFDPRSMAKLIEEFEDLRGMMHTLIIYNDVMIPLVYTQVVIIAVYSFFLLQLFSQQFVDPLETVARYSLMTNETMVPIPISEKNSVDMYIPIFTVFQFLFLMGWLKVAMCVLNPFGDDDEDFSTSEMLDGNLETAWRYSVGDHRYFPEGMEEPSMEAVRPSPGCEKDTLVEYLDHVEQEYEQQLREHPLENLQLYEIDEKESNGLSCCPKSSQDKADSFANRNGRTRTEQHPLMSKPRR